MTQMFMLTFTNQNRHEDHDAAFCIWRVHCANKHDKIRFKGQNQADEKLEQCIAGCREIGLRHCDHTILSLRRKNSGYLS